MFEHRLSFRSIPFCMAFLAWVHAASALPNDPATAPSPHDVAKNRYISFAPNNGATPVAFDVNMTASAYTDSAVYRRLLRYSACE